MPDTAGEADTLDPNAHGAAPPMSLDAMIGSPGNSIDKATSDLADLKRKQIGETSRTTDDLMRGMERDQARVQEAARHTAIEPGALKPWNEEYESAKRQTDPIAAFASFGSVFGILASAFTHAPMANALNASAAAINAIKEGNEKDYDRAYKAWQDNTKLALDRHKIEHEQYQDAIELMKTNLAVGEAKLKVLFAKFGAEKELVMLDNGMDKEVIDTLAAKQKLATSMQENFYKMTTENAKMSQLFSLGYDPRNPMSEKSQKALKQFQREYGETKSPDQQFSKEWWTEHPEGTSEEFSKAFGEFKRAQYGRPVTGEQEAIRRFMDEHPDATADEVAAFVGRLKQQGKPVAANLTVARQQAQDVSALVEKYKKDHPDATPEQIAKYRADTAAKLTTEAAAITGNRKDELKGKINQVKLAEGLIDKVDGLLLKHKAITGLGGTLTRPVEIVGNIIGSNETDRKQFERDVLQLQEIAPRILMDTKGRPLSAEAGRINGIIAGLRPGDTGANTVRAYIEFRDEMKRIRGMLEERAGEGEAPPEKPETHGDWWKTSPVVDDATLPKNAKPRQFQSDSTASFNERYPRGAMSGLGVADAGPSMDSAFGNVNDEFPLGNALRKKLKDLTPEEIEELKQHLSR